MRYVSLTCALAGAGFLLSGCSSHSSVGSVEDSALSTFPRESLSTSTPSAASSIPGVIDCIGTPIERPTSLSLKCSDDSRILTDINWSEWSATEAKGTGVVEAEGTEGAVYRSEEVPVELSSPVDTPQGRAFTRLLVAGEPEQP